MAQSLYIPPQIDFGEIVKHAFAKSEFTLIHMFTPPEGEPCPSQLLQRWPAAPKTPVDQAGAVTEHPCSREIDHRIIMQRDVFKKKTDPGAPDRAEYPADEHSPAGGGCREHAQQKNCQQGTAEPVDDFIGDLENGAQMSNIHGRQSGNKAEK